MSLNLSGYGHILGVITSNLPNFFLQRQSQGSIARYYAYLFLPVIYFSYLNGILAS